MTQRNPMNERYQSEDRKGATRKSAASAKPVSKAASSVRIESTKKTPQQKKAERKQQRAKDAERDRQFYNPPTAEYKRLRKIWWVCLILSLTVVSFAGNNLGMPAPIMYVTLALAYVFIIAALYIDMGKCRKARQKYADEVLNHPTKEMRAAEKQQKAAQRAAKQQPEQPAVEEAPKKRGLFGNGFRLSKAQEAKAEKQEAKAAKANEKSDAHHLPKNGWEPWFLVSTLRRSPASTWKPSSSAPN